MATYVMSDIHGCYTEYMTMLEKINFDPSKDEMIIAGDIVDRGKENYEMLEYAASNPEGVLFLMGNHDKDFIYYVHQMDWLYQNGRVPKDIDLPTLANDSEYSFLFSAFVGDQYDTVWLLINDEDKPATMEDFHRWAKSIEKFPYFIRREKNRRQYIIVHAGYISEEEHQRISVRGSKFRFDIRDFYVWAREEGLDHGESGSTIVFGHTPTISPHTFYNHGKVWMKRIGKKRFINIDCGCVFSSWEPEANLACIRLEDEKIFYLK